MIRTYLSLLLCLMFPLWGIQERKLLRRASPLSLETSVIIPCASTHFSFLEPLLNRYAEQTILPNEVIISLSSTETLSPEEIQKLQQRPWPFPLTLLQHPQPHSPGFNRNAAVRKAAYPLLICQDADDLPHPQRVEAAKYFFEQFSIALLLHFFCTSETELWDTRFEEAPLHSFFDYDAMAEDHRFKNKIHNGNICLLKDLWRAIQWEDVKDLSCDKDVQFNRKVFERYYPTAVLSYPLVIYRVEYSAFPKQENDWSN